MMTALTGNASSVQALVVSMPPTPSPSTATDPASAAVDRATAPDTATISAAGQNASQASRDVDHDGDSH
jgi:hypothetical protein